MVEVSNDLTNWRSGPAVVTWSNRRETLPDGMERVGVHIVDPQLSGSSQLFSRLRVIPLE